MLTAVPLHIALRCCARQTLLLLVAVAAAAAAAASSSLHVTTDEFVDWFVDPITVKVMHGHRVPFSSSAKVVDLAAQRGECERVQIWLWDSSKDLFNVTVDFGNLSAPADEQTAATNASAFCSSCWVYKQQGYVNTSTSSRYKCMEDILTHQGGAWPPPPPIFPPTPPGQPAKDCDQTPWGKCWTGCPAVQKNWTDPKSCNGGRSKPTGQSCNRCACNSKNVSCHDDRHEAGHACLPGWYPDPLLDVPPTGIPFIPKGFTQPIYVEVCVPYDQPPNNYIGQLQVSASSHELFTVPVTLEVWNITIAKLNDTDSFNTAFNFNDDLTKWYPPGTALDQIWADWMPFLAHYRVPGDSIYLGGPRPIAEYQELAASGAKWMGMGDAGISFRPPANGTVPPGYVDEWIKKLAPAMADLKGKGLLNKSYIYGFDE